MSPIDTSELERRLGAGLDARSRQASVPSAEQGRAAIADRVVRRRRHRRTGQAVTAVVVVAALVAAGIGLTRHDQQSDRVVTGVHQQVPPLPQLGLPAHLGQTQVDWLYPGNEVVERLSHLPQFTETLSVAWSDQSLDQVRETRSGPDVSVASARVGDLPAITVTPNPDQTSLTVESSGVYWKPDAHHLAALDPGGQSVAQAVALAGHLIRLSDSTWWSLTAGAPSGQGRIKSSTGGTTVARVGPSLNDPAARLGLPGGRTAVAVLANAKQQVISALDVAGFSPGTFALTTNFDLPITAPLAKVGDKDSGVGARYGRPGPRRRSGDLRVGPPAHAVVARARRGVPDPIWTAGALGRQATAQRGAEADAGRRAAGGRSAAGAQPGHLAGVAVPPVAAPGPDDPRGGALPERRRLPRLPDHAHHPDHQQLTTLSRRAGLAARPRPGRRRSGPGPRRSGRGRRPPSGDRSSR